MAAAHPANTQKNGVKSDIAVTYSVSTQENRVKNEIVVAYLISTQENGVKDNADRVYLVSDNNGNTLFSVHLLLVWIISIFDYSILLIISYSHIHANHDIIQFSI